MNIKNDPYSELEKVNWLDNSENFWYDKNTKKSSIDVHWILNNDIESLKKSALSDENYINTFKNSLYYQFEKQGKNEYVDYVYSMFYNNIVSNSFAKYLNFSQRDYIISTFIPLLPDRTDRMVEHFSLADMYKIEWNFDDLINIHINIIRSI